MSETLEKLRPDRDLQCYFFRPSAIAALSEAGPNGYKVSGTWRQQLDWAVIEWNRDNVFEHPSLRPLPDGDLSGLTLTYRERRTNCIAMDATLFPTVDWPYLRIWAENSSGEEYIYRVRVRDHATPVAGGYVAASAEFDLGGELTIGDVVEVSWLDEHYFESVAAGDTVADLLARLAGTIDALSPTVSAQYRSADQKLVLAHRTQGEEGNRLGVVATVKGEQTELWTPGAQTMSGGESPSEWRIDLDFGALVDRDGLAIPAEKVRKMRWTYSAALQAGAYERSEFEVAISDWQVAGANRLYAVAGPGSKRVENDSAAFAGEWQRSEGNFSGGSIHKSNSLGSSATVEYSVDSAHRLFLGARATFEAGRIAVSVDGGAPTEIDLFLPGEDALVRLPLGDLGAGSHVVTAELAGKNPASANNSFYFDFVEAAVPATAIEARPGNPNETMATDWDTDHSLVLSPERVAWNLWALGFHGRANHYVGAILFYELTNPGNVYASGTVTFSGTPVFSQIVQVTIDGFPFTRLTTDTDTNESIAKKFEYLINNGSTGVWAEAAGATLTIHARALGSAGNALTLAAAPTAGSFQAIADGASLSGGLDGQWLTDTASLPRINRAARDWHRSYFVALKELGWDATVAYSTELSHGDPSPAAGIAQRYPDGSAVLLNTPAIQTNFSPASIDYWKYVYRETAALMAEANLLPYLQFGEVQWWYFPQPGWNSSGMTFYDEYTTSRFAATYGRPMHVFVSNTESPDGWPEEAAFLPSLIGEYTAAIRAFVLDAYPDTRFEVLYPPDVNDYPLMREMNYPKDDWTPANLNSLKTENFSYTQARDMNKALESIRRPFLEGFERARSSHLIGVMFASEPWTVERRLSRREGVESIVYWAFDQFSMIGYALPLPADGRRARYFG